MHGGAARHFSHILQARDQRSALVTSIGLLSHPSLRDSQAHPTRARHLSSRQKAGTGCSAPQWLCKQCSARSSGLQVLWGSATWGAGVLPRAAAAGAAPCSSSLQVSAQPQAAANDAVCRNDAFAAGLRSCRQWPTCVSSCEPSHSVSLACPPAVCCLAAASAAIVQPPQEEEVVSHWSKDERSINPGTLLPLLCRCLVKRTELCLKALLRAFSCPAGVVMVRFKQTASGKAKAAAQAASPLPGLQLKRLVGKHHTVRVPPAGKAGKGGAAGAAAAGGGGTGLPTDSLMLFSITDGSSVESKVAELRGNPGPCQGAPRRHARRVVLFPALPACPARTPLTLTLPAPTHAPPLFVCRR